MKNVIAKKVSCATNQIKAMERYETTKLNMSTLDEIVDERFRYDIFLWVWRHANDFVQIFAMCGNTLSICRGLF